jgi:acyl dehydratase
MTDRVSQWRSFGAADCAAYAELTQDFNPLHLDPDFAAGTPMGRPIVYGTLVLALVWELFEDAEVAEFEVRFRRPVFVGEAARAEREAADGGRAGFRIVTDAGEVAVEGEALLAV